MSNIRRSWSKVGKRTVYQNQQEYSNRYLYSAIDPIDGDSFHLIGFDDAATEQTDLFLKALKEKYPDDHLVIVWDNAPFHRSKLLHKKHMTFISLPPYSPQLNPVERFFEEMRKVTANKIFQEGIDALTTILNNGIVDFCKNKTNIQKLCGYDWIQEQWNEISNWMITR